MRPWKIVLLTAVVADGRLRVTGGPAAPVMDWVRPVDEAFGRVELTPTP